MSCTVVLLSGDTVTWNDKDDYGTFSIHPSGVLQVINFDGELIAAYAPVAWLSVTEDRQNGAVSG